MTKNISKKLRRGAGTATAAMMLSCSTFAFTSVALLSTPLAAQAQSFRFTNVIVEGSERVSAGTILSYAGISRGQTLSAAEVNDAYQKVIASGLFESVEFVPNGATLVIKVTEYPLVSKISIEGNRKLNDAALLPLIKTSTRRVYSPATVEQDALALTEAYEVRGQLIATVTPKIIRRSQNRVDVVFTVTEGKGVEVESLTFVGNRSFSDARLRRVLETKQAGLLRFIVSRDTYAEDRIEFDKRVLTDFYQSRGYVDFQVLNVSSELSRERDAFFVTFNVREGLRYKFGEITTSSEIAEADSEEFQKTANIRSGQFYTPTAIETVISRMETLATKKGIDFLRVEPRVSRNERTQTLDIEFVLVKGPRVFIERIDIEGNQTTLDRVVRRQFKVVEGDPFNPREIREAAGRIRALGFFSQADVNAREGSSSEQVVVDVDVTETTTGSFTFGGNYSVSGGANLIASYKENNFLGRGQSLNFNLTTELETGTLSFNFLEPAFLGRDVAFGLNGNLGTSEPIFADHSIRSAEISPRLSFPISANGRLSLYYSYGLSEVRASDSTWVSGDANLPTTIWEDIDEGRVSKSAVGYSYSFDSRRNGLNPNAGVLLRFGQEFAGLGGDVEYLKTNAEISAQTKVLNNEVTLSATLQGGIIESDLGTRVEDRFFNSPATIRGFATGGIGPRDVGGTDLALGGNYYAVARLEAQFPLGLPEEYGVSGGLFFDYGSVWGLDDPGAIDDSLHWRSVLGASVFWTTPLGPLRFNFTKALDLQDYDEEQRFDLTISTRF